MQYAKETLFSSTLVTPALAKTRLSLIFSRKPSQGSSPIIPSTSPQKWPQNSPSFGQFRRLQELRSGERHEEEDQTRDEHHGWAGTRTARFFRMGSRLEDDFRRSFGFQSHGRTPSYPILYHSAYPKLMDDILMIYWWYGDIIHLWIDNFAFPKTLHSSSNIAMAAMVHFLVDLPTKTWWFVP